MKQKVFINGKPLTVYFDNYTDIKYSLLLYTKVMSIRDKETGESVPILFEKERMDFINFIYSKDKHKFVQAV
ncbi:hypothetical protein [Cohnella thermotolerans]|uniref:hypothetical protein n=1 Tax=Cohnella thermotolerans TaxID=329858 RepID=UPI0012EBFF7B|nr:hypothetical protein [Cohnella thermotolerans]